MGLDARCMMMMHFENMGQYFYDHALSVPLSAFPHFSRLFEQNREGLSPLLALPCDDFLPFSEFETEFQPTEKANFQFSRWISTISMRTDLDQT